jgi:hypothetical protein
MSEGVRAEFPRFLFRLRNQLQDGCIAALTKSPFISVITTRGSYFAADGNPITSTLDAYCFERCGSLRFQTPKARLQSSSGLFLDFSWVAADIVDRIALLLKGGWDAFSKTPTASNPVICLRVE